MRKFLPKTLTSQTIWVLLIGLSVSHFLSMVIYSGDRTESLSMLGGRNMAQRIASVSHVIIETPSEWRGRIVAALNEPTFRVSISPESTLVNQPDEGEQLALLKRFLRFKIGLSTETPMSVQLFEKPHDGGLLGQFNPNQWMHMRMMNQMHGISAHQSLRVSFTLPDGNWLNFATDIPESNPFWSATSVMSLISMSVAVIVLSIWVVRRLTVPLRSFAHAARQLGKDVKAEPMLETGPLEVQEAAKAFNEMQGRLQRLIENRTQMLAAISHDLRTPITLMRLRSELVEDETDRQKMLETLDDMEHMISLTLEFAKQESENEERRNVDIAALVESICDDMEDTGKDISLERGEQILYECALVGMKRVVNNLISNAIKYGDCARVSIGANDNEIEIVITDKGPGIPEDQLEKVLQPFYRCEASRNRNTGGVGLGLSIAQSIIEAHGGELILSNRTEGGLEAKVLLPR
jgi:signal transduction histidine kinase